MKKKLKILHCCTAFESIHHGPAKFAHLILEMNQKYSEEMEIKILTEDIPKSSSNIIKAKMRFSSRFPQIGMVLKIIDYYHEAKAVKKNYPFDILIFGHAMLGLIAALFLKKTHIIGMINDDNSSSISIKKIEWSRYWWRYYIFRIVEKIAARKINTIVVNSNYLRNEISEKYKLKKNKLKKLYKSIRLEKISSDVRIKKIRPNTKIKILFVKSNYVVGGLETLIKALKVLSDYEFELYIVGPPPDKAQKLVAGINPLNIELHILGKQPQKVVHKLMKEEAHIFCVPSLKEGLGVANMEAMAHKLAVVSSNSGGIPEVLDNGRGGWLCTANDENALAKGLENCISNTAERITKIEYAYNFVQKHFSHEIMLFTFKKLLFEVYNTNKKTLSSN